MKIKMKKKQKSIYGPIKDQFLLLVEYIKILEIKKVEDRCNDISNLIEFINIINRQCEIYLKYKCIIKEEQ
jgi:hypothetical protein